MSNKGSLGLVLSICMVGIVSYAMIIRRIAISERFFHTNNKLATKCNFRSYGVLVARPA